MDERLPRIGVVRAQDPRPFEPASAKGPPGPGAGALHHGDALLYGLGQRLDFTGRTETRREPGRDDAPGEHFRGSVEDEADR